MVTIYSYKNCGSCKKAAKFLAEKNIKHKVVEIVENPPNKKQLKAMLETYGGNIKKLFNTSGLVYRELNLKDKLPDMSDAECIALLSKTGKLVKRPFLMKKDQALAVGFKADEWSEIF